MAGTQEKVKGGLKNYLILAALFIATTGLILLSNSGFPLVSL